MAQTESSVMIETLNFTQNCKHGKSPDCCTASPAYLRLTVAKKKESLQFSSDGNKEAISI
jgi:hypothetical protein